MATPEMIMSMVTLAVANYSIKLSDNEVDIKAQTPAQAKGFVTDDKLKKMKLYQPGMPHLNDAMRHLVYYIVNKTELHIRTELLEKAYK